MKREFEIEVLEVKKNDRFIFRGNYSWKACLNASQEKDGKKKYSLPFNLVNFLKLKELDPTFYHDNNSQSLDVDDFKNENFKINKELRPYQKEDVNFLSKLRSVAIFNEMRTGKTPTSLMVTSKWNIQSIFIIVPSILQQQWQLSVEEWLKKPAYVISYLSIKERHLFYRKFCKGRDLVLIISKDVFKADSDFFSGLRKSLGFSNFCVIIDESHYLRNYKSQQSKSIYSLSDASYKILLTGTPIVNSYSDIFGTLKFVKPQDFTSYWKFVELFFYVRDFDITSKLGKRVFFKSVGDFKSRTAKIQLKNEIASFSVNRKQKDVLPWLPTIIRQKELLIMDEEQQEFYNLFSNSVDFNIELLSNLKSITLYPKYLIGSIETDGVKIRYLVNFCEDNEKKHIIIFSTRSDTFLNPLAKLLAERSISFGIITGEVNGEDRKVYINEFQKGNLKILLCNIQSAGFGLNLSRADTIIFADRSYSPADNDQAESRFLPTEDFGENKVRMIIDLVCKDTIDEMILKLLEKKKDIKKIIISNPKLIFGIGEF